MTEDFKVIGAGQLFDVAQSLKAAADKGLQAELKTGIRLATKPLIALTREAAREQLPKRGGLNERVARAPQRVTTRSGAASASVRITAGKRRSGARGADEGFIRHPIFWRPPLVVRWIDRPQPVRPGWFTKTLEESAPVVLPFVEQAIKRVRDQIEGGV